MVTLNMYFPFMSTITCSNCGTETEGEFTGVEALINNTQDSAKSKFSYLAYCHKCEEKIEAVKYRF